MLKLLIPVLGNQGATEAARHSAFMYAERCVSEIEIIEVLDDAAGSRSVAFHSLNVLHRREMQAAQDALMRTREVLEDAGVPYTCKRVYGPAERTIAQCAEQSHADIVILDASHLGFFHRWAVLARLWHFSSTPVTMLH